MTKTSDNGKGMFACFVAIIVAVFSCLVAFLIVTLVPKTKAHSNYYVFESNTEDSSGAGAAVEDLLKSKTELFFSGDKYYTVETILDTEPIRSDPADYVISDGRIFFDINSEDFNKLSQEERNLLPSYKITADKLIMEDGNFVCEGNQKMFLTGIIGLSVSIVLSLIVVSMIISYNRQMRAVYKEILGEYAGGGVKLKQKIKALPRVAKLVTVLVLALCFFVPGVVLTSGAYASHSKTYVTYLIKKTFDEKGDVSNHPDDRNIGDSYTFYKSYDSKEKIEPDVTLTYTFKGKKLVIKTESVNSVVVLECDYIIKSIGQDLEKRFGDELGRTVITGRAEYYEDTRLFFNMNEEQYKEYIDFLKAIPESASISTSTEASEDGLHTYYENAAGEKVYFKSLDEVSTQINLTDFCLWLYEGADYGYTELDETYHRFGPYNTSYWSVRAVGIVFIVLAVICLLIMIGMSKDVIALLKNRKNPAAQTAGAAGTEGAETTSAKVDADGLAAEEVEANKTAEDKKLQKRQRIVFLAILIVVAVIVLIAVL